MRLRSHLPVYPRFPAITQAPRSSGALAFVPSPITSITKDFLLRDLLFRAAASEAAAA